jgi:hypothetical protein
MVREKGGKDCRVVEVQPTHEVDCAVLRHQRQRREISYYAMAAIGRGIE